MGQVVGTVSKRDHLSYYWNLGNKSLLNIWKSPDFVDFPFSNPWLLHLNQASGLLSVCHQACPASFSFDMTVVLKYSTTTEKFHLNDVTKCEQYWDVDTDAYALKSIEIKNLESIYCTFTNVRGVCGTAVGKDKTEMKLKHDVADKTGKTKEASVQCAITDKQETKIKHRVTETKRETREASSQCTIKEFKEERGQQETKLKHHVVETKKENKEASIQCALQESAATRGLASLSADLRELFVSEKESDVTIQVGDQVYPVHKNILRARSPVFEAMLKHDMMEKTRGVVDIPDCSPYIFGDFLLYLYTGKLDGISVENAFELYRMSDKYNVKELKADCVDFMIGNLTVGVIGDVISLATKHCEEQLLSRATEFFVENARDILPTVNWQKFVQGNPIEANELFIKAFK